MEASEDGDGGRQGRTDTELEVDLLLVKTGDHRRKAMQSMTSGESDYRPAQPTHDATAPARRTA